MSELHAARSAHPAPLEDARLMSVWMRAGVFASIAIAIVGGLIPSSSRASCAGLTGPDHAECAKQEAEMIRRYQEDESAARERVLAVETGRERLQTTEYDLLYGSLNECQFLKRQGPFRVVDEDGGTFSEGSCFCCTQLNQEGQKWVPRTKIWRLHGRYIRYQEDPPGTLQTDYWCGVETQQLNELHRKSIVAACE